MILPCPSNKKDIVHCVLNIRLDYLVFTPVLYYKNLTMAAGTDWKIQLEGNCLQW
jgi:hypothetical protein